MNLSLEEGRTLVDGIKSQAINNGALTILATPYLYLHSLSQACDECQDIHIAAQNMHHLEKGAFTGEISAQMLTSIGVKYVVLGHSERREYQKESNALLKEKVDLALAHHLIPVFCCGESLAIRQSGDHISYVCNQLKESLFHLSEDDFAKLIIAYEPIWAIGTGETATPQQAQDMQAALRKFIADHYGQVCADNCSILYGGSVKPGNAQELFSQADVDGGLVGGASLKAEDFNQIRLAF